LEKVNAGEITAQEAHAVEAAVNAVNRGEAPNPFQHEQPQAVEQAQPEASEQPPSGVSEKVARALSDPEIRQAIEQPLQQAEQARQQYVTASAELAQIATAGLVSQFPELQKYSAHELPAVLNYMAQHDPARHAAIIRNSVLGRSAIADGEPNADRSRPRRHRSYSRIHSEFLQ
jgi:hypothetical protein